MYTQCPRCQTIFEINEDALQASLGIVRCGQCSERFDSLRTLSDTLPAGPETALPKHDPDALAPTLTSAVSREAIQAAPEPAHAPASKTVLPSSESPDTAQPNDTWFDAFSAYRARALIADAAGIPLETIHGNPAWQLTDLPMQTSFTELDIIPMAAAEPVTESVKLAPLAPVPTNIEAAESEPFTNAWGLDIPDVDLTDPTASGRDVNEEAELSTANDPLAEFADDIGADIPLAATETEFGSPDFALLDAQPAVDDLAPERDTAQEGGPASTEPQDELPYGDAEPADVAEPVYVPPRRHRIRRRDWLWAIGCMVLALALAAQVAWASRIALVRDPATQAQVLRVCARFDCRLPPIRDTAKLELLSRDVRPDPDAAGALTITATFRNNAPYRQPWPIVVVELTDLDNSVVAMRRFRPVEYMPDATRRNAGISANTTAAVAFEVADPGKSAVSFHFSFE